MICKDVVVVTGGAGFIGSHLIELLIPKYRVVSIDNYFIGDRANHIDGAEYIRGSTKDIKFLIQDERPKIIFHLGEYSRVEQSFDDIELVFDFNITGTFQVLEYWRKRECKLVYAGSSTKFADGGLGRDQSPYAWMKASNTELVRNYGEWFNLPYAITYFYNAYGPRELSTGSYASVIGRFKEQYRSGRPLTVVSPGTQRRTFTHVRDIANGILMIGEGGRGDDYGLGSGESLSILEVSAMFGGEIEMLPERKGNRMEAKVDTFRVNSEFGWSAKYSLGAYIEELKEMTS
jgi:UDP-glucose 4-epimerase